MRKAERIGDDDKISSPVGSTRTWVHSVRGGCSRLSFQDDGFGNCALGSLAAASPKRPYNSDNKDRPKNESPENRHEEDVPPEG
jgi:hypothetical protein